MRNSFLVTEAPRVQQNDSDKTKQIINNTNRTVKLGITIIFFGATVWTLTRQMCIVFLRTGVL